MVNIKDNIEDKSHSESGFHVCDWIGCEAKFMNKKILHNHKRIHLGKNLTKDKLFKMIDRNEVIKEIDENNALVKVFRALHTNDSLSHPILGFGCNWTECQFICCKRSDINLHINAKHTNDKEFICDQCESVFSSIKYLKAHKSHKHRVGFEYKCHLNGCEFETKYKCSLDNHLKLHKGIKASSRVRPSREKKFTNSKDNKPSNSYSESRSYVCDWSGCEAKFRNKMCLQSHKRFHLGKNSTKDKLIQMIHRNEVIEQIDQNNALLKVFKGSRDKNSFLNKFLGFGCNWNDCQYISCKRLDVISHISRKHTKEKFICDECERVFHCEKNLKFHKSKIHKLKTDFQYKCDWNGCEYKTNYKSSLNVHIKRHKGVKSHLCVWPGCEAAFVDSADLKSHLKTHSGSEPSVKPYVCDWPECDYRTKHKSALNSHKRTHLGLKPYSCDWTECEAKFSQKSGLEFHKLIHTGNKRFVCNWPECHKKFRDRAHLNEHLLVHQNIRPIVCLFEGCDRRFIQKVAMIKHLNTHK